MDTSTNIMRPKLSARFFFLSLGVLVSLITSVVSFLNLVFETLNRRFPDVLNANYMYGYSTYQYEGIRTALSILIIFFPVYLLVSYFWKKYAEKEMGRIDEIIRKWVIYIILFLSSLVVVIDLVALVRYFVSGEITTRFILKVVAVLLSLFLVGAYYIYRLRAPRDTTGRPGMIFGGLGIVLVVATIIWSFAIMGSPGKQRMLRFDDRRVSDLQNIQYQVINYWQQKEKLPTTLEELANPLSGWALPVPPQFEKGETYEYRVLAPTTFELCATFALPMPKGWQEYGKGGIIRPMPMLDYGYGGDASYPYPGGMNESWDHEAGRTCFERTIDKDLFPPYPKPTR